jgi:hypothetical protein
LLFDKNLFRSSSEKNSTSNSGGNGSINQGNETQQMSIGSVGSITASPMQQNLSVHSQPSSIPIHDQSIISPHQNDVSPHPLTPILENSSNINSSIKTEIDDLKAGGNSDANKHEQQQKQATQDASDASKMLNGQTTSMATASGSGSAATKPGDSLSRENILKRPALMIQDCENNNEEDFTTNQSLYDYSTWDAW